MQAVTRQLERQHTENALVNSAEGLFVYESLQCLQFQGQFTESKGSFGAKTSVLEPLQVFGQGVFRPIDNPGVFSTVSTE